MNYINYRPYSPIGINYSPIGRLYLYSPIGWLVVNYSPIQGY